MQEDLSLLVGGHDGIADADADDPELVAVFAAGAGGLDLRCIAAERDAERLDGQGRIDLVRTQAQEQGDASDGEVLGRREAESAVSGRRGLQGRQIVHRAGVAVQVRPGLVAGIGGFSRLWQDTVRFVDQDEPHHHIAGLPDHVGEYGIVIGKLRSMP